MEARGTFDPDTITLLRTVLDEAWDALPPTRQARTSRTAIAQRLLALAADGERDPQRLRAAAMTPATRPSVL